MRDLFREHIIALFGLEEQHCHEVKGVCSNRLLKVESDGEIFMVKKYRYAACYRRERWMLEMGRRRELQMPRVLYAEENAEWSWLVYRYLAGHSLNEVNKRMTEENLSEIMVRTGKILKQIHQWYAKENGLRKHEILAGEIGNWQRNYELIREREKGEKLKVCMDFLRRHVSFFRQTEAAAIIVNDITDRHIIVDFDGQGYVFQGIIDLEQAGTGCRGKDFRFLCMDYFFRSSLLERAFFKGYGEEVSGELRTLMMVHVLGYALELFRDNHVAYSLELTEHAFEWYGNGKTDRL